MPYHFPKVSFNNMMSSQYQFLFVIIFLVVYICNADSSKPPKRQTYKSCEKALENQFLPRNCPVGYDRIDTR